MMYPRPFKHTPRALSVIHSVVVHESTDPTEAHTRKVLTNKDCGTHVLVNEHARVTWDHPPTDRLIHTPRWNTCSIGIELVSPYYARSFQPPWTRILRAPWAHKGRYVVPTLDQLEALYQTILILTSQWEGTNIPRTYPGVSGDGTSYYLRPVPPSRRKPSVPGVWAHHHTGTGHTDGAFPVLYCILRDRDYDPPTAYLDAVNYARGCRGFLQLPAPYVTLATGA